MNPYRVLKMMADWMFLDPREILKVTQFCEPVVCSENVLGADIAVNFLHFVHDTKTYCDSMSM